jgi:hypothetical protein
MLLLQLLEQMIYMEQHFQLLCIDKIQDKDINMVDYQ